MILRSAASPRKGFCSTQPQRFDDRSRCVQRVGKPDPRAAKFGSFVHRVLETLSLPDGQDIEEILAMAADEFGQPEFAAVARPLIVQALGSDLVQARLGNAQDIGVKSGDG